MGVSNESCLHANALLEAEAVSVARLPRKLHNQACEHCCLEPAHVSWVFRLLSWFAEVDRRTAPTVGVGDQLIVKHFGSKIAIHDVGGAEAFRGLWGGLYEQVSRKTGSRLMAYAFSSESYLDVRHSCPTRRGAGAWDSLCGRRR